MMDAREFLREELLAVAATVVPTQQPVITHDPGPVNPGALFDGRAPATVSSVTVETGNPTSTDPARAVAAASAALQARGWQTEIPPPEDGHHRLSAHHNGFDITVHAWTTDWRITFTGQTPPTV
ncbi:hypothetical protein [Kribbella sp. NPDC051620]|uniref:hypothetical protein n=1 Tax=Kribbella sp. NPDC051620 TaxID=3364120 RepID=UPI0037B2B0E1